VTGEFVALLTTLMMPVNVPEVAGAKVTVNVVLWPAVKVSGVVSPAILNPESEALTCEIFTFELPVLASVTPCVVLAPTLTLPKLTEDGVAESC